jgi:hypothetical protein
MSYLRTIAGTLAIMMASWMIVDFELIESGNETYVRVWSPADQDGADLRKQVAAMLPRDIHERHVIVVPATHS